MHVDIVQEELYVVNRDLGTTMLLADEMGYGTDAEGPYVFPDVGQGWFRWMLDDEAEDEGVPLFDTPSSRLRIDCVQGDTRYRLYYEGGGVEEEWRFTAGGNLEYATYADTYHDTDVRLTQLTPSIPQPPTNFDRWPGLFTYETLYDEVDADDYWYVGLRVGDGQNGRLRQELTLDAYVGETFLEELDLQSSSAYGDYIGFEYTDHGKPGVLDEGDLIDVVLDLEAADGWYLYDTWSEQYFEEEVIDTSGETEYLPWSEATGSEIEVDYDWSFDGWDYELTVWVPEELYDEYGKRSRAQVYSSSYQAYIPDYQAYIYDALDDDILQQITDELTRIGAESGLSDDEVVSLTLAFVQSLEYTSDSVTTPYDEFPRYPVETLVEEGGDCEDTSILFASLVQLLGYDVVMLSPPAHMAVGVYGEASLPGTYYEHDGRRYYFAETTGEGWTIGQVPETYSSASAQIYEVTGSRPTLVIDDWTVEDSANGRTSDVWFQFSNTGAIDSRRGTATVYATDGSDRVIDWDECDFSSLEAGYYYECELVLSIDGRITDYVFEVMTVDGYRAYERASEYGT